LDNEKTDLPEKGYFSLFNGKTLDGWHTAHRLPTPLFPGGKMPCVEGEWKVEDI
jgi:hypothetical protein